MSSTIIIPLPICPAHKTSLAELEREEESKDAVVIPDEQLVAEYYDYRQQLDQMAQDFRDVITHPTYSLPFLQPGRLVKVKYRDLDFGWGVVINFLKRLPPKVSVALYYEVLLCCSLLPSRGRIRVCHF